MICNRFDVGSRDRYEIFAASSSAMVARIPIAHLHGGESTEGAFDEALRHSIPKMSHSILWRQKNTVNESFNLENNRASFSGWRIRC